jgi:hypothetical protein
LTYSKCFDKTRQTDCKLAKKYFALMMTDSRFPLRRSLQILTARMRAPLLTKTSLKIMRRVAAQVLTAMTINSKPHKISS